MKKYIKYGLLAVLATTMFSCEDYLTTNSDSELISEELYSDPAKTEHQLLSVYDLLGENRSYRKHLNTYTAVNTDIEMQSGSLSESLLTGPTGDRKSMALYNMSPNDAKDGYNDAGGKDPFSRIYTGIERVNLTIDGIRTYGDTTNLQFQFLLGEALTLRAFFYNDLIKLWGDVPARFEPVSTQSIYVSPSDRNLIYDRIIADLERAEELVPWAGGVAQNSTVGRVSKAFVKGLKARICLNYAGYALRSLDFASDDVKSTFANSKVCRNVTAAKKAELYAKARIACKDVIDHGSNVLTPNFVDIFKDQCQDKLTTGKESIFELPFADGARGEYLSYLGLRHEFAGDVTSDNYTNTTIKGELLVVPSFFYDFNASDSRRDVTACPYKWVNGRIELNSNPRSWYLGKWRAEWTNRVITSNDDGVNFCVLRYADVLLMFAEAENELSGPTTEAQNALLAVRNRSISSPAIASTVELPQPDYSYLAVPVASLTKDQFFQAIVQERAFEFCGENIRKWDLIRWGMLKQKMDEAISNMEFGLAPRAGRYAINAQDAYIYWRNTGGDATKIELYGFKPGEDKAKFDTDYPGVEICDQSELIPDAQVAGTWIQKKSWLTGQTATGSATLSYFDNKFTSCLYKRNPDEYQLFPFMSVIVTNSQGFITNKYSY